MPCAKASARCGSRPWSRRAPEGDEEPLPRAEAGRAAAARVAAGRRAGVVAGRQARCSSPGLPDPQPVYNGNPLRNEAESRRRCSPLNAAFQLWRVAAPLPVHEDGGACRDGARAVAGAVRRDVRPRVGDACGRSTTRPARRRERGSGARQVPAARRGGEERSRARRRSIDEMVAEQPLIKPVVTSNGRGRRLRPSARVRSRPARVRERRQRRRRDDRRVVRARRGRARSVGHRRRWFGGALPQGHEAADGHRLQGHDADHARRPTTRRSCRTAASSPTVPAAANIPGVVAGLDYLYRNYGSGKVKWDDLVGAGDHAGGRGLHPRRGAADEHCRRPPLPREVAGGGEDLPARRQGAAAGRSLLQQGLRDHPARHPEGRRRGVLQGRDREEDRRRHGRERRHPHATPTSRSTARSSARRSPATIAATRSTPADRRVSTGIQLFESLHVLENYQPKPGARGLDRRRTISTT